ncbi:DUF6234 family protein [Streptomyces sp. NPDC005568]|uniref:DUF6234 family protein n=1 Tax=Streptomyces sp. NPDC005568 TaxID=3156887 RepID=UPI0033A7739B
MSRWKVFRLAGRRVHGWLHKPDRAAHRDPGRLLLGLTSVIRGWGRVEEQTAAPPMDWVPILWLGGFTLGVLVIAFIFLRSAHPFAGAVQLVVAAVALFFTIAAWHDQHERAHPPPLPTRAGMPSNHVPDR